MLRGRVFGGFFGGGGGEESWAPIAVEIRCILVPWAESGGLTGARMSFLTLMTSLTLT